MRIATEKQLKRHQRRLESLIRNRWAWTALYVFMMMQSIVRIFDKRAQWPHLFAYPPSYGVPLWHSVWENILTIALFLFALIGLWWRVHNYRREQLAAKQEALRKAALPTDGIWPPPPQSPG